MGTIIAALEEMELVEREPHPTDGRQHYIQLTPKGSISKKRTGRQRRSAANRSFS
jgi:DNA-binding MarR family transcriptional regulator